MDGIEELMPLSPNLMKERLNELKRLFPDLFTSEGKLNPDELKKIIEPEKVHESERYEFRWYGKTQAKKNAFSPSSAALLFDEKRSVNPENSSNIIIEGENLEVLKLLTSAYRERIKCIYIDPPYNTGQDFVYSDNYTEDKKAYWENQGALENGVKLDTNADSNGRYHSNWLSMMYSRLLIARQLLSEDGVIFVSIDDNEVHNLRKLMDEVFGDENFLATIVWKKTYGGGAKVKHVVDLHEYIICFAKDLLSIESIEFPPNPETRKYYKWKDEKFETRGPYRTQPLATTSMDERPNLRFPIIYKGEEIWPEKQWQWSQDRVEKALKDNELVIRKKSGKWSIRYKQYLYDESGKERGAKPFSVLEGPYTQIGTNEFKQLLGDGKIFPFPKPTDLIKEFIRYNSDKDAIVLDFFAGSGTTGQAVLELNKEDSGNRQFILVQLPEITPENSEANKAGFKKISNIAIERCKRVIEKISKPLENSNNLQLEFDEAGGKKTQELGFKVFKLRKSNFPRIEFAPDPQKTTGENVELLKKYIAQKEASLKTLFNADDIMVEVLLKNGFTLNYKLVKQEQFTKNEVFLARDENKESLICLDNTLDDETVEWFKKNTENRFICLENALDTTRKWNLKHYLGSNFKAF